MSNGKHIKETARGCEVTHKHSGKRHIFEVKSSSGNTYDVIIQTSCSCINQNYDHKGICGHTLACLHKVISRPGDFYMKEEDSPLQAKRNIYLEMVHISDRDKIGKVRYGKNEGEKHREKKKKICLFLDSFGQKYITECRWKSDHGTGRADIFILDIGKVIEIVDSETEESIEEKKEKYPPGIEIEVVKA